MLRRVTVWFLLLVIAGCGGVVVAKASHNHYVLGWLRWQDRVEKHPEEALDRTDVRRYGLHQKIVRLPSGKPACCKYSVSYPEGLPPMSTSWGPEVKCAGYTGNLYGFTLRLDNMDDLLLGAPPGIDGGPAEGVSGTVRAFGCACAIVCSKSAVGTPHDAPYSWTADEVAAWDAWKNTIPEDYTAVATGFLYSATVAAGTDTDTIYKVVGWVGGAFEVPEMPTWVGDTSWDLAGSFGIVDCVPVREIGITSSTRVATPRYPGHVHARHHLEAGKACRVNATLGSMSVSDAVAEGTEVTPGNFVTQFTADLAKTTNTDYISLTGLSCSSEDVPVSTANCNFWGAADGYFWAYWTQPDVVRQDGTGVSHGAPMWRFFGTGSDYHLHRIDGSAIAETTYAVNMALGGPVRYKVNAGRFGPEAGLPLPGTPRFEVGVGKWPDEVGPAVMEMLAPGTMSDWYVACSNHAVGNVYNQLFTGKYEWSSAGLAYCLAEEAWLDNIGDNLSDTLTDGEDPPHTIATADNHYGAVVLASVKDGLDVEDPYWGPALTYTWQEVSGDIPPGETERPTLWTALADTTVDETDNGHWTVGPTPPEPSCHITNYAGGETVSRPLTFSVDYEGIVTSVYGLGIVFGGHDVFIDNAYFMDISTGSGSFTVTIPLIDINNNEPVPDGTYAVTFALSDGPGGHIVYADNSGLSLTVVGGTATGWTYTLSEDPEPTMTGGVTRALASRKPLRFAYMGSWDGTGTAVNEDWPLINRANFAGANDPDSIIASVPVEDVRDYDNCSLVGVSFTSCPEDIDWSGVTLTLHYSTFSFADPCFAPPSYGETYRFGVDSDFADNYSRDDSGVKVFYGYAPADGDGKQCLFDLGALSRSNTVNLQHVDSITISGLPAGDYQLEDLRLVADTEAHGATSYPHWIPQQAVNPWNWMRSLCGFGSTYEGVSCLNLDNGTYAGGGGSPFNKDVEYGLAQTQFVQYNPEWLAEQEEAPEPTDPSYANPLYRSSGVSRLIAVLSMQEQVNTSALDLDAIREAIGDGTNELGDLFYWDLQRGDGENSEGLAALHVGIVEGVPLPCIPQTYHLEWSSQGAAHGIAYHGSDATWARTRLTGGSSDTPGAYRIKVWRQPVDEAGDPTGAWELVGSCQPDATGRYRTSPQLEKGYAYEVRTSETQSLGGFVTREYVLKDIYLSIGIAQLHALWHGVSGKVLLLDCNLAENSVVGHRLVNRQLDPAWSARYPMTGAEGVAYANLTCDRTRIDLVSGEDSGVACRLQRSLAGAYASAATLTGDRSAPFGVAALGLLYTTENADGKAYFVARNDDGAYATKRGPVEIGDAVSDVPGALVMAEAHRNLFAALQDESGVTLYGSSDQGATWVSLQTVAELKYPHLTADQRFVWLAGYQEGETGGATGQCMLQRYRTRGADLTPEGSLLAVGPADEGRSAIIARPGDWKLFAFAPKTQDWTETGATPGIAEYHSADTGATWTLKEIHGLT